MSKPIIGIPLDYELPKPGGYSQQRAYYALRENYSDAVADAGGVPVLLPYRQDAIGQYVAMCSGFLIAGSASDIDPKLYGNEPLHPSVKKLKPQRAKFEWALIQAALEKNKPILGICNGAQMINVVMGGTMIQHIPDAVPNSLTHDQKPPFDTPAHDVKIHANTKLRAIVGADHLQVNSSHHQSIQKIAPGAVVNATAPDGVIEGIESPKHKFVLGVQWHPEYFSTPQDSLLFKALINASQ